MIWFLDWIVWLVFLTAAFTGICALAAIVVIFWAGIFVGARELWRRK